MCPLRAPLLRVAASLLAAPAKLARPACAIALQLTLVLASCGGSSPTPTPVPAGSGVPPTSVPSATPTVSPARTSSPAPTATPTLAPTLRWRSIRVPSIPATAQIRAVVGRPGSRPLLVAVGTRDGEGTGAAQISVSGEEWSRPIWLEGSRFATDVVVAGSKFVVVGSVGAAAGSNGIVLAAYFPSAGRTWRSTNGRGWTVVDPPQSAPHADIRRVTSGPDGLLALGGMDGGGQVTWRSRNGARWARPAELSSDVDLYDVVSVGPRTNYLAVGASWGDACPDTDGAMPAAWSSVDGSTWTRLTGDDVGCGSFSSVVAGPGGFVAAGSYVKAGTYVSAAWHSADGRSWQGPSDFDGGWVEALAVIDDVYVAVGDGIWESTDGREWQRVVDTQGVVLAAVGGGVAIGVDPDGGIAWIAEPSR